jgi:hypothetical protein
MLASKSEEQVADVLPTAMLCQTAPLCYVKTLTRILELSSLDEGRITCVVHNVHLKLWAMPQGWPEKKSELVSFKRMPGQTTARAPGLFHDLHFP